MPHRRIHVSLLLVLALAVPVAVSAQSAAPASSATPVVLAPFVDEAYGLRSVEPVGWTNAGMGIRARNAAPGDQTLLALQSAPVAPDALWPSLLPQLGLTERPQPTDSRTTPAGLEWAIYRVPIGGSSATADLAVAATDGTTYLVLLLAAADEADALRDAVFLPAVDALEPLVVERTPLPSGIGYSEREVSLPGGAPDVTLAGTLTTPAGDGPHPAVVLMSGSGAQDRDESLPGMTLRPFALLADALGRAGVAVLRYDDRGTAASTGDYAAATIADLASDGQAAMEWLRGQPEVDPARVGILGHSEGGAYVASIAANDPDVAFVVGLAPMVRSGIDLLVDQTEAVARSQGASAEAAADTAQANRRLYEAALADDPEQLEATMRAILADAYDDLEPAEQTALGDREAWVEQQLAAQLPTMRSPWFVSLLRADPSMDWAKVAAPVLGVFGGKDVQVIAGPESTALEAALGDRDGRSQVEVLADANHLFQAAETGALGEYPTLEQAFVPELLPLVTEWVRRVTGLDG